MHLSHITEWNIQNRNMHISVLNGASWLRDKSHAKFVGDIIKNKLNTGIL